ncbi:MAG TPA: glycosyltransferase family 4 protein [Chthonomonadaceae bacterium]|nr:glycosyltransferase family 4 protein [Chthonomonadaceae bacterium]
MSKVLVVSRCAWSLTNYRRGHMNALRDNGDTVIAAGAADGYVSKLEAMGIPFVNLPIPYKSINPLADLRLLAAFYRFYRRERPDVVHHFTIKPVIYGSIAARLAGVPQIINTVTGLGFVFTDQAKPWLRRLVETQYRIALSGAHFTFFQNEDDRSLFVQSRMVRGDKTGLLPGSGVDTTQFKPCWNTETIQAETEAPIMFLMMSRLLKDKGVYDFVDAARMVRREHPNAEFFLLGKRDEHNPAVVPKEDLDLWQSEGAVKWLGEVQDVRGILGKADVVVLPSYYREGTPRSLLEAAAMGKPIITTDNVGCREVVENGVNGLLVPIKNAPALADAMRCMIQDPERRLRMGIAGREKIVREFDEAIVIERVLDVYKNANL